MSYDAWLHWGVAEYCNLSCNYCVTFSRHKAKLDPAKSFIQRIIKSRIANRPIDIGRLIKTLNGADMIFRVSFSGHGEPLLIPNIMDVFEALTSKHYISFNTNLTPALIEDFVRKIDPGKVVSIDASLHIRSLERHKMTETFIRHYNLCKNTGFNITASEVAYPDLAEDAKRFKRDFKEKGVDFFFQRYFGEYEGKSYPDAYTPDEEEIFGLAGQPSYLMYESKGKKCNAGYNVGFVRGNGDIVPCDRFDDILGNIYKEVKFKDRMTDCPFEHCYCPLNCYDKGLFERAVRETCG